MFVSPQYECPATPFKYILCLLYQCMLLNLNSFLLREDIIFLLNRS